MFQRYLHVTIKGYFSGFETMTLMTYTNGDQVGHLTRKETGVFSSWAQIHELVLTTDKWANKIRVICALIIRDRYQCNTGILGNRLT